MTGLEPPVPRLRPLFRAEVQLGTLEDHGITRAGHRRVVPIIGGAVSGAFAGEVLTGGADWQIVRDDGTVEIDTRYSLRTDAGELVHLRTRGIRAGSPDVLARLLAGGAVPADEYYFRLVVELESAAARLATLERTVIVASGIRTADTVVYDAYSVT